LVNDAGFEQRVPVYRARADDALKRYLPPAAAKPARLHEAMRYSVLGPGKRIRPLLAYACGEVLGLDASRIDPIAAAIEFLHAYSLVHDDLPSMDDDDLRRGRPTTHVAFDEATAILVGDTLQALAFLVVASDPAYAENPGIRRRLVREIGAAAGSTGMVGGQVMDLAAEGGVVDAEHLERIYALKTGCLIRAAIMMPCHCVSDIAQSDFDALDRFSRTIGLAFQIRDDLLEVDGSAETIGKSPGSDRKNAKATYPELFGLATARERAASLYEAAMAELDPLASRADSLRWLSDLVIRRTY
jgi:geranylgeranyl pyrophosphate synthase